MRKLAWFAAAFSGAAALAVYLLPEALLLPGALLCAVGALAGLLLRGRARLRWLAIVLGLATGLLWTGLYAVIVRAPAVQMAGEDVEVHVLVLDWPAETRWSRVLPVEVERRGVDLRALLYLQGEGLESLRPGDRLTVRGSVRTADSRGGEPTLYYGAKGITLVICADAEEGVVSRPERVGPRHWPVYVAKTIKESVTRIFPDSAAPLVTALITGEKTALPGGDYSALRRAGLAHMVAVSGMHVSFLGAALGFALGRGRKRTAAAVIVLLLFFAGVAGNTPSVLRAVLMGALVQIAPLVGRENDRPTTLLTVLMLLLMGNPWAIASVSLQLSFAAMAGIYLFAGRLQRRWTARLPQKAATLPGRLLLRMARGIAASVALSIGALAFTTPLSVWYFDTISILAPLSNLLVLWAVSLLFTGGLILALLGLLLPGAAAVAALPLSLLARWVLGVARAVAKLSFAAVPAELVPFGLWLLLVYGTLLLCLLWGRRQRVRPVVPLTAVVLTLCAALTLRAAHRTDGALTLSILDVGGGLAGVCSSEGQLWMVNCGGGPADAGDLAADYVQSLGAGRVEALILTDYREESWDGLPRLLERIEVGELLVPGIDARDARLRTLQELANRHGVPLRQVWEETCLPFGQAEVRLRPSLGGKRREQGLSVQCSAGTFDALFTGNLNLYQEHCLVKYGGLPDLEVLVVGRSGAGDATGEELLLGTRPEYAVISAAAMGRRAPDEETLERLAAAGCAIYRTDWQGTVTFTVGS